MRIGLIRHFKVDIVKKSFMTAEEYDKYSYDYERAGVIPNELVIDKDWDKCYCSSLQRAITTAQTVYDGEIIITDKLVEIPAAAMFKLKIHLPYNIWALLNRIAWIRNHASNPEGKTTTMKRINEIMEVILSERDKNILIVSHAGTLHEIKKILMKKGFRGSGFLKARNGKLYLYNKS